MLYIDVKFANILGSRLRNFKKKNDYLWNFSCPVCGDSATNKLKARAYLYRAKTDIFVKCHNCNYGTNLGNLIKHVDPTLYDEYVIERYKSKASPHNSHKDITKVLPKLVEPVLLEDNVLKGVIRLDTLDPSHPAVKYCIKRKIPEKYWHLLYFSIKFKAFVNSVSFKFINETPDHPRLIIPYFTPEGKCFAFQGRAFGKEEPKYITIKIDENKERIFGLDRIDYSKRILVVEGPIDSLFLPNAIAVSGASFDTPTIRALLSNATIVMDNEPRSKEITKLLAKNIALGYNVCLFPDTVKEKDINEQIISGKSSEEITAMISSNTFSGIEAELRFNEWRKC
ncbi:DNA primase [uncultured Caudovirales phage]|uniref:DNA primase n=1 Tax=uncultured Caudovirales phage TaxID=2100421 RepID=A0A6J5PDW5_9CAUD|nr:DNA primase [uncultured Caudovirales phage]CAB4170652.1 DNA primase [uncultured Caudovirales phage]CAB4177016.1 DNA primase [uncultured Caudovirales phage]CAB4223279.1 DNA primase [uncultured Caudovirales phage]